MSNKKLLIVMSNLITILSIKLLSCGFDSNELVFIFNSNGMNIQDAKKIVNNIKEKMKNDQISL